MRRAPFILAVAAIVAAGLALRLVPLGLPRPVVKCGGSALWGAMVYILVLSVRPRLAGPLALVVAGAIAIVVEASRLVPVPALDAFRLTLAGQMLLGRVFSMWNLLAYAAGIGTATLVTWPFRRAPQPSRTDARHGT